MKIYILRVLRDRIFLQSVKEVMKGLNRSKRVSMKQYRGLTRLQYQGMLAGTFLDRHKGKM